MSDRPERRSASPINRREALRITAVAGLATAFGGGLTRALLRESRLHRVSETRTRMGTVITLTVVSPHAQEARAWITAAFSEMERLEGILSRHRPDTAVGRLNAAGRVRPAPIELVEVLTLAAEVSEASAGGFDVTVLPLLRVYEAARSAGAGLAPEREVDDALMLVDHRALIVDGEEVRLSMPGMGVTLDGIAKGYVVDRTIDLFRREGAERVLVDAGGDMSAAGGDQELDPWTVGIQDPHGAGLAAFVRLSGESIATSGDYMNSFTEDRRAHHILDPRTGRSPGHASSVSVVSSSAMRADALSTAVMVLGPTEGVSLLERSPESEGFIVTKSGRQVRSSGFGRLSE